MALQKHAVPINFAQGLDTKTDPFQVQPGKFLSLENSIFTKGGLLSKRNGFTQLASLPDSTSTYLTTFNGNLTAIGNDLKGLSEGSGQWVTHGDIQPVLIDVLPLVKNTYNQVQTDSVLAPNGLLCVAYTESNGSSNAYKYSVIDSTTGQSVIPPKVIPVSTGVVSGSPRVFLLGNYFVIVFTNLITGTSHLQYIAISIANPSVVTIAQEITSSYVPSNALSWDGIVTNDNLYIAYNTLAGGQSIKVTYLTKFNAAVGAAAATPVVFPGRKATVMSLTADTTNSNTVIYVSFYDSLSSTGYTLAVNPILGTVLAPTQIISSGTILNITSVASNGFCQIYYEVQNAYSYDSSIFSNFINHVSISQAGSVSSVTTIIRSLGIASKAFYGPDDSTIYFLGTYNSQFQPTYFLINASASTQNSPVIVSKIAYENGIGHLTLGLPSVSFSGTQVLISYLFKDLIQSVNKAQGASSSAGIYAQTGINLVFFNIETSGLNVTEIGNNLNLSGGFLWGYDGVAPVENNFFVWPDNIEATWSATGGSIHAQPDGSTNTNAYFYQVTYEWTDNQGNIFRSAPSIPIGITTSGAGTAGSITLHVPTLRLTYKVSTPVKIVIYRWSVAQQTYYQVTSVTNPTISSTSSDSITYVDTLADSSILGNSVIYTTGGVIENINAPAPSVMCLYKSRLILVDSEDKNLLWYSKQVIEATPVEMSDLFTIYVAPTTGAQGSTGKITALSAMDDKLVIFKRDGIYYITGSGPDNTGANNDFSDPIFITGTVGCEDQRSIVMTPQGLMFQSDKGIWLLDRGLNTIYIGAAVEKYNDAQVLSALTIPGTNQVRFTLDNGITLMYDYFYTQWGSFTNIPAISSTLYQNLHTFINSFGQCYQETPGKYLDGSSPVLMSFQTSWFNLAGLQGYQRAYFFYMLAEFFSPHKIQMQIAYDYAQGPAQTVMISPDNYSPAYGGDPTWGYSSPWGGTPRLEQWRVFFQQQRCQSFQITFNEIFDASYGQPASIGLTVSGLNLVLGLKKGYVPIQAKNSVG